VDLFTRRISIRHEEIIMNRFKHILLAASLAAGLGLSGIAVTTFAAASNNGEMAMQKARRNTTPKPRSPSRKRPSLRPGRIITPRWQRFTACRSVVAASKRRHFEGLANHCDKLAASYRQAASDARAMAASLREMAKLA